LGHDEHFLSRLERVSNAHVELALSLYRNPELVRHVLTHSSPAEGATRVALSLDDTRAGPYLVVARDGHFVTCLGEGMTAGDLPVVTRGQIDAAAQKLEKLRLCIETATALLGPGDETSVLLRRMHEAGPFLSREEFLGLASLQPLLGGMLWSLYFRSWGFLVKVRPRVIGILRAEPRDASLLRTYWERVWSLGPLSILGTMDARTQLERLPEQELLVKPPMPTSYAVGEGIFGLAVKAMWGAGKVGKLFLPGYKREFLLAEDRAEFLDGAMGLLVLALRHAALRAEVRKALRKEPTAFPLNGPGRRFREGHRFFNPLFETLLDKPEAALAIHAGMGKKRVLSLVRDLPEGAPHAYRREEDVPDSLALCVAANGYGDPLREFTEAEAMLCCLPFVARAEPEDFFPPASFAEILRSDWQPEHSIDLVERWRSKRDPLRAGAAPGPNEPCSCGSGKKYKRCCGM
jgi:hypothetical protein